MKLFGSTLLTSTALCSILVGIGAVPASAQVAPDLSVSAPAPGATSTPSSNLSINHLFVGNGNGESGTLNIGSGITVNAASYGVIGNQTGAVGTVNVTGSGAILNVSTSLRVGDAGSGTMTMSGGATGTVTGYVYVGGADTGSVSLSGVGTMLTMDGFSMRTSSPVTSSLSITGGAVLNDTLGFYAMGPASITVSGAGSELRVGTRSNQQVTWANTDGWFSPDSRQIEISNGALLDADGSYIGGDGTATMVVTGAGTRWLNGLPLYIGGTGNGNPGNGTVTVSAGAYVRSATSAVGVDPGATGTLTITGSGTIYEVVPNAAQNSPGNFRAGFNGTGTVTVSDGAQLKAANQINIATNTGSVGVINIGAAEGAAAVAAGTLNGGTLGVVFGDGSGTLVFNHTDTNYVFDQKMSGPGATIKHIAGVTHLTGDSSGLTANAAVSGGQLYADGNLGGTAFNVTGGSLGGTGTVGAVTIGNGASLNGTQGSGLTLSALTLNAGASMNVTLGAPSTTSVFTVNGNLTLNGTLNITGTTDFGAGLYRIINYSGTLTNNGFALGARPSGFVGALQTAVAGQVNIVVDSANAPTLFWNGSTTSPTGTIVGGSGTWTAGATTNWINQAGTISQAWNSAFAVFQGAPGTVTVDGSAGPVSATGMQFVTSGYTVRGGPVTLTGAAQIRVGDGTNAGAATLARIDSVLTGSVGLEKTDLGTLVLTGANTYTGGTTISAGTLQIGNGGTTGSIQGNVTNNGTLAFNRSDDVTFAGTISGTGAVVKNGAGTLVLTSDSTYAGGTTIAAGTLQIGNGGTTGSITGNVVNNGSLAFNRANDVAFGGALSGAGTLVQKGTGTLVLTGANTHTGGTTIASGTLQIGNGGTTGSLAGNVANSGTLAFNRSDATTFAGVVSGTGSLIQKGTGTVALTGANTYTGGTTIAAGTLQVGNGGTTGSILGDVANSGTLAFSRSDGVTFAGVVSGTGALAQRGEGTLVLTGANTYTGGTTIAAGTLQIGNGGTAGSIQGNVANSGTLAFNHSDDVTFAGVISGSGSLVQKGTGTLILTGDNTYTGVTTVSSGTLQIGNGGTTGSIAGNVVNNANLVFNRSDTYRFGGTITGAGSVTFKGGTVLFSAPYSGSVTVDTSMVQLQAGTTTSSPFTVGTGGVLGGSANIGSLTANTGGTVSPGYSPGTLTVNGPVAFNAGSIYAADVAPNGDHDLIAATGTATIAPGAILRVSKYGSGAYPVGASYTVLTAAGGVTGRFILTGDTSVSAFYTLADDYSANAVTLRSVQTRSFASVAQTPNQIATAGALQGLAAGNSLRDAVAASPTEASARASFDQLSGEIYGSVKTALIDDSRFVRDATAARLDAAGRGAPAVWMRGYGMFGSMSGDGNAVGADKTSRGVFIGTDADVNDTFRLGFIGGYGRLNLRLNEGRGSAAADTYSFGVYGAGQWDALGVSFGANHAWHDLTGSRSVSITGLGNRLSSASSARTAQVYGEVNYTVVFGDMAFKPFAGLAYVNVNTDGFGETGGSAALTVRGSTTDTAFTTVGLRASRTFDLYGTAISANGMVAWRHDLNKTVPTSINAFSGGGAFAVSGLPVARDVAGIEAGFSAVLSPSATFSVNFSGQYGSGVASQGVNASLSIKF